jgi:hypothetical protein
MTNSPSTAIPPGLAAGLAKKEDPVANVTEVPTPPPSKTYFHTIPGANTMIQVGPAQVKQLDFIGGHYSTSDPAEIEFLDTIVNVPGSLIYSDEERAKAISEDAKAAAADTSASAEVAHKKMIAAGEKVA